MTSALFCVATSRHLRTLAYLTLLFLGIIWSGIIIENYLHPQIPASAHSVMTAATAHSDRVLPVPSSVSQVTGGTATLSASLSGLAARREVSGWKSGRLGCQDGSQAD